MIGETPVVSIVVPAYNHAAFLREAVESILGQDYPHIELIVIDDGSTDDTKDILASYTGRFHWETQTNRGQVATLNRGWNMSRGDILGYLSADDLLLKGAVSAAVRCLDENPDAVLAYCDFNLIDPSSSFVRRVRAPAFDYREMVAKFVCPPGPGAFFRRSAFQKAGVWNANFHQMLDYEYWLRLGMHGRFVRIPEVLAAFRVHPGSQTFAVAGQVRSEEPIRIIESYFERPDVPDSVKPLRDQALSAAHLVSAQLLFRVGNYRPGLRTLWRAFKLKPGNLFSARSMRIMFNAIFNKLGHRLLWNARRMVRSRSDSGCGAKNGEK